MRTRSTLKGIAIAGVCMFLGVLAGCAGLEYAPKRTVMYYHKELPAADRAVDAARAAGKDKECPAEFQAAEKAKNEAYEIYWSCRTKEGIAKANEAAALAKALGLRLDSVVGYSEYVDNGPVPYFSGLMMDKSMTNAAPEILAGTNDVSLNVSVTYKLAE